MAIVTIRNKVTLQQAVLWNGGDYTCLDLFCGKNWGRADAVGSESWPSDIKDDGLVVVFNTAVQAWLPVPTGWWIIRGLNGELYPCKPDIFEKSYEIVGDSNG